MKPEYRYFRHREGTIYKLHTATPTSSKGNTRSDDGGETWETTCFTLEDLIEPRGWDSPAPVEYFPDAPTYRYFRQGCGEWKVQTADPESHEGNFYRNAETPWLSASHSLTDLLAMGATEVGTSEEQVPGWAVAGVYTKPRGGMALHLALVHADTEVAAIGYFTEEVYKECSGASLQKPIVIRVP